MKNRDAAFARQLEQLGGFQNGVVDSVKRQLAVLIFELRVDDDESGFVERARVQRSFDDLKK